MTIFEKSETLRKKLLNNEYASTQVASVKALLEKSENEIDKYWRLRESYNNPEKAQHKETIKALLLRFEQLLGVPDVGSFDTSAITPEPQPTTATTISIDIPFNEVVEPFARKQVLATIEQQIEEAKQQILSYETPPPTWTSTKKEYIEKNASKRKKTAEQRDELKQKYTAINNGDTDPRIAKQLQELNTKQNGIPTQEQRKMYIQTMEQTSFDKVKNTDYFPTPPDVARQAIELASISGTMRILEPSAGKGNIADAIKELYPSTVIDVCEIAEHNQKILTMKGYNLVGTDFLEYGITGRNAQGLPIYDPTIRYDAIVMNPPFQQGMDWEHIEHAYNLLKTDGVLVAIAPGNSYVGLGREATEKRTTIEKRDGTIDIISAKDYNKQMEFTSLTIDIALIRMVKQPDRTGTIIRNVRAGSRGQGFEKVGTERLPDRSLMPKSEGFIKPKVVAARSEIMLDIAKIPNYLRELKLRKPITLFDYQYEGINRAIHGILTHTGFLLADGTGAGKTIQMLITATYFYQKFKKPVAIFTVDDRVIETSFMEDAIKLGFNVPDYVKAEEMQEPPRPANYDGLYDALSDDERIDSAPTMINISASPTVKSTDVPNVYRGNDSTLELKDGINIFRYYAIEGSVTELENDRERLTEASQAVDDNREWWYNIQREGMELITKDNEQFFAYLDDVIRRREQNDQTTDIPDDEEDYLNENTLADRSDERVRRAKEYSERWKNILNIYQENDSEVEHKEVIEAIGNPAIKLPRVEKAKQKYVIEQDRYETRVENYFSGVSNNTSLLVWDEAHKIKNQLLDADKLIGRSFHAKFITRGAKYVLYATATPADRPYDIMYLQRCGLYSDEDQFISIMRSIGVDYTPEKRNELNEVIKRAKFSYSKNDDALRIQTVSLTGLFDRAIRTGGMIRREIQYTNLDAQFVDVMLSPSVEDELENITNSLKKKDSRGKVYIDKARQYQRHLEALEEHKVDEVIRITQQEIAAGKNVIIFTNFVDEGTETRDEGTVKFGTIRELKTRLAMLYGEDAIGVLAGVKGRYEYYQRKVGVSQFQKGEKRIMIGTINSGGTGVNLDDVQGNAPRTMIVMTAPLSFINVMQGIGRVVRANTKSRSTVYFLFGKYNVPEKSKQEIPVEKWLKNLIANKFRILRATVKGEIDALSPDEVRSAENGGESAVNFAEENTLAEHSEYTFTKKTITGWRDLPSGIPLKISRYGNIRKHYCIIQGKDKTILEAWADNNKEFIEKWGLVKNIDRNYQTYNGSHYGIEMYHRDHKKWEESREVWNAMLNILMPEDMRFITNENNIYNISDTVYSAVNFRGANIAPNEQGTIVEVFPVMKATNATGSVYSYLYTIQWSKNGYTSTDVDSWKITKNLPTTDDEKD